ncbi:uncharacterized protein LOC133829276 [Humulus lupulus]|uniref:uncharacterized protein LOC133829276 n=1 Tax=Humulus lupulus TaxID=3486 RepID=UPI002B40E5E1|nr:uncharacterized protein LOC133829276 [Humulus lupulus]
MTSVCISNCVNDARDPRVPVRLRATYVNLYKWPESDAEFVRSVSSSGCRPGSHVRYGHPRVVDSISCRQMYLRSYTFSRKETPEKTQKCFGRVKQKKLADDEDDSDRDHGDKKKKEQKQMQQANNNKNSSSSVSSNKKKKCLFLGKVRELSYAALFGIFQRCLSCAATVDVADQ